MAMVNICAASFTFKWNLFSVLCKYLINTHARALISKSISNHFTSSEPPTSKRRRRIMKKHTIKATHKSLRKAGGWNEWLFLNLYIVGYVLWWMTNDLVDMFRVSPAPLNHFRILLSRNKSMEIIWSESINQWVGNFSKNDKF